MRKQLVDWMLWLIELMLIIDVWSWTVWGGTEFLPEFQKPAWIWLQLYAAVRSWHQMFYTHRSIRLFHFPVEFFIKQEWRSQLTPRPQFLTRTTYNTLEICPKFTWIFARIFALNSWKKWSSRAPNSQRIWYWFYGWEMDNMTHVEITFYPIYVSAIYSQEPYEEANCEELDAYRVVNYDVIELLVNHYEVESVMAMMCRYSFFIFFHFFIIYNNQRHHPYMGIRRNS